MITPESFTCLSLTVEDDVAEIRLTRPALLNRFDQVAHAELVAALVEVTARADTLRVLILSAEGKVFSAGGDMDEMIEANGSPELRERMAHDARAVMSLMIDMPIPVIAAVQGAAIGLGVTLVGLADIAVAWRGAKIADTHVAVGLVAGDGGLVTWTQAIGINRARRYLITGDAITGQQAYDFGLVTELVDTPEAVLPRARELAARIKALPAAGVNGTKRGFAEILRRRSAEVFDYGLALEMESMATDGFATMVNKFRGR